MLASMDGFAMEKIAGGKLLIVKTDHDEKINKISIQGDFFAHPEESIDRIQEELKGLQVGFEDSLVNEKLQKLIDDNDYQLIGFDAEDLIRVLKRAISR